MTKRVPQQVKARVNYLRVSDEDGQYPERSYSYQRQLIEERLGPLVGLPASREYRDLLKGTRTDRVNYQRMLADARAGLFSDLCVYHIDRFGRSPQEVFNAVNLLQGLGIKIWVADMPNMEIGTPTGNLQLGIQAVLARYEIDLLGQRVRHTKRNMMLQGKWPSYPPDGYVSRHEEISSRKRRCWIEQDPTQARMVRDAYDLWLTGTYTLQELCEELHKRGHTRRSGKPLAWDKPGTGQRQHAGSHIQRILTNPFHAGWVVSRTHGIERGQVRGEWDPIVTDEELDRSLAILREHDHNKSREKRHPYMLRGVLYLDWEGRPVRLYGSTPTGRSKSYGYYVTKVSCGGTHRRVRLEAVESRIPAWLQHITINPSRVSRIRDVYRRHIDDLRTPDRRRMLEELEARVKMLEDQEADIARLLLTEKISEATYDKLRKEWHDKLMAARLEHANLSRESVEYVNDLESALKILARAGWIFERLDPRQQGKFIQLLARKIVVNLDGEMVKWELNAPFEYLSGLADSRNGYQGDAQAKHDSDTVNAPMAQQFASMARFEGRSRMQSLCDDVSMAPD